MTYAMTSCTPLSSPGTNRSDGLELGVHRRDVHLVIPAAWGPRRRTAMRQAAHRAGLGQPTLVEAPIAAAQHLLATGTQMVVGAYLAVCDVGGGFEATVLRRSPTAPPPDGPPYAVHAAHVTSAAHQAGLGYVEHIVAVAGPWTGDTGVAGATAEPVGASATDQVDRHLDLLVFVLRAVRA
jgi:hypothetical protein